MSALTNEMSILMDLHLNAIKMGKKLDRALSLHGVSFNEFLIMLFLSAANQHTTSRIELAELLGITASGITRLLNPMEKNGIVEKQSNPRDARVSLVKLTTSGFSLYQDCFRTFELQSADMLPEMRQYQADTVLAFLKSI